MAFFGLTQLGEQNYFHANSVFGTDLGLFNSHDFVVALDQLISVDGNKIMIKMIPQYLEKLYKGPLFPETDCGLIEECLAREFGIPTEDTDTFVSRDEFLQALEIAKTEVQKSAQERVYTPCEYNSNARFREATRRNERLQYGPKEKYMQTCTANQNYGWNVGVTEFAKLDAKCTKRYPKVSSEETTFADAMTAAGNC
uniref:Uncharacterized protein n=1 Tax=Mucochytrium quahogii TaxID=96639 RepID=A0A7S2SKI1_9STRA|mmetsp:Transcript_5500/g.8519  ORF Transcript_5500/g.8519 Transcript_5500/m.8519 type:complete len:198 (-) Transcript_5500:28-621(-)